MRWLALTLCLLGCTPQYHPPDIRDTIRDMRARTAQVKVSCPDGDWTGSTVILWANGGIARSVTAAHVAQAGCEIRVWGAVATLVAADPDSDLALLEFSTLRHREPLRFGEPYLGQAVVAVGYPRQMLTGQAQLQVSRGSLLSLLGSLYKTSAQFTHGSSGGPVFDEQGRLVGIAVSVLEVWGGVPIDGEYFLVPVGKVRDLVTSLQPTF